MPRRYLIIGDGAAGTTAAATLRSRDPQASIAIISDDPHPAYFRAALTNYLLGELREEQIWAVTPSFYEEHGVTRIVGRVAHVDTARSELWMSDASPPLGYDGLVVASGARARPPAFDGSWLAGVMTMRTLHDVRRVMDLIKLRGVRHALVVGGGPLALEWAHGLMHRGAAVTMMVRERRFMPNALDPVSSDLLAARLRHAGVQVRFGDEVAQAQRGPNGHVAAVLTKSGERIPCDLVCVAIGVVCNSEFLRTSGVSLAPNGGVVVSHTLQTSQPNIFAAGDVAFFAGRLRQLWEPARAQAEVAAANLLGDRRSYAPGVHYLATRLYDLDFASLGEVNGGGGDAREFVHFPQKTGAIAYRKVVIRGGRVAGSLMIGERAGRIRKWGRAFKRLIDEARDVSAVAEKLVDPAFDLAAWMQTTALTTKPKAQTVAIAASAQIRKTHELRVTDLPIPGAAPPPTHARGPQVTPAMTMAVPSVQSIGVVQIRFGDRALELTAVPLLIGRDPKCGIVLDDPDASAWHAEIRRHGGSVYLRDLGSHSGTWVNGKVVTVPRKLCNGDRIRIGRLELGVSTMESRPARPTDVPPPSAVQSQAPYFQVRSGQALGVSFALTEMQVTIGRDPSASIRLDDACIAPIHCQLQRTGTNWVIADATGLGLTRHNGVVVAPGTWTILHEGDTIDVGEAALIFHDPVAQRAHSIAPNPNPHVRY